MHDIMVDLKGLLVATVSGGVHAGTEVDGVEVAANLGVGRDGQTGVGAVAEGEVSGGSGTDFDGERAELDTSLKAASHGGRGSEGGGGDGGGGSEDVRVVHGE